MSKASRLAKREREVTQMEVRFASRLRDELEACVNGRWGLLGQNDGISGEAMPGSRAARELLALLDEIDEARNEMGYLEPFELGERFKSYRSMRGANVPGEPKLAARLLSEIEPRN